MAYGEFYSEICTWDFCQSRLGKSGGQKSSLMMYVVDVWSWLHKVEEEPLAGAVRSLELVSEGYKLFFHSVLLGWKMGTDIESAPKKGLPFQLAADLHNHQVQASHPLPSFLLLSVSSIVRETGNWNIALAQWAMWPCKQRRIILQCWVESQVRGASGDSHLERGSGGGGGCLSGARSTLT